MTFWIRNNSKCGGNKRNQSSPGFRLWMVLCAHLFMGYVALEQFLSLLPKANSSEIPVLLLTPQHSSTGPTAREVGAHALLNGGITVSQRPLGAPPPGPSAGNSPVAKNNSQTDDRLNIGGDHTLHVPFPFLFF